MKNAISVIDVAYLGPPGTYSHLVARKRFGPKCRFVDFPTIQDVCAFIARHPSAYGIIPNENSSGGAIYETVDILLAGEPRIFILEERSLNVRLALLGHSADNIKVLYSHFAPLEHCSTWLKDNLPKLEHVTETSTAAAAQRAAAEPGGAALGSKHLARMYGLKILHYPVQADVPNITTFLVINGRKPRTAKTDKTSLAVKLPNVPGALRSLLDKFFVENVNLSRIISRPIRGCPREYAFLVDIDGGNRQSNVSRALNEAAKVCVELKIVGSYPVMSQYAS